jgi:hypothetical protein
MIFNYLIVFQGEKETLALIYLTWLRIATCYLQNVATYIIESYSITSYCCYDKYLFGSRFSEEHFTTLVHKPVIQCKSLYLLYASSFSVTSKIYGMYKNVKRSLKLFYSWYQCQCFLFCYLTHFFRIGKCLLKVVILFFSNSKCFTLFLWNASYWFQKTKFTSITFPWNAIKYIEFQTLGAPGISIQKTL